MEGAVQKRMNGGEKEPLIPRSKESTMAVDYLQRGTPPPFNGDYRWDWEIVF